MIAAEEREADRFALCLLVRPVDFAGMLDHAADVAGAPRALPWWSRLTASHPPIDERAAACRLALVGYLFEGGRIGVGRAQLAYGGLT